MERNIFWADIFRFLNIVTCGLSIIMAAASLIYYGRRQALIRSVTDYVLRNRLMEFHVYAVGAASILICIVTVLDVYERFNTPLTFRGPLLLVAFSLFAASQIALFRAEVAAMQKIRQTIRFASETTDAPN